MGELEQRARAQPARAEILRSCNGKPPPVYDPFCGGGSIPLEAQRLGLEAHASDLNPVPVLINKALIEIPPKFAGKAAGEPGVAPQSSVRLVRGRARRGWPRTFGTTANGCATRRRNASAISIPK